MQQAGVKLTQGVDGQVVKGLGLGQKSAPKPNPTVFLG
jgi:hypothetical protein